MAGDEVDEDPLYTMKQASDVRVRLPPFSEEGLFPMEEEEEEVVGSSRAEEGAMSEAEMVRHLKRLRCKFDDLITFCLNMSVEKAQLASEVTKVKRDLAIMKETAPSPEVAKDVSDFEAAFDDAGSQGYNVVQVAVASIFGFIIGFLAHRIPGMMWDFLDAGMDSDHADLDPGWNT